MRSLDEYLPQYEFSERHSVRIDATPARVEASLRSISMDDLPVARLLLRLRALGRRAPARRPFVEFGLPLEDVPGEGVVLGITGQFWRIRSGPLPRPRDRSEFMAFDRGDVCKAVMDFRFTGGELSTETRVHVADPAARRKFARYWRVIRPFSGLTRIVLLRETRRRAEAGA